MTGIGHIYGPAASLAPVASAALPPQGSGDSSEFSNSTVFLHANDQFGSRELVVKGVKTSSLSFPMEYIRVLLYEHNIKLVDCQG